MRLRFKILSGFFILALMLLIAGIWSIYQLQSIGTSVQDLLDENYKSINASKTMLEALEREDSGILLLMLGNWREGRSIITSADSLFEKGFQVAANNLTIPNEKTHVDSIKVKYKKYKNLWEKPIVDTEKEGNLAWYFQIVHESFLAVKGSVNDLMSINDQAMFTTASDLKNRANRAIMPGVVAIIAALVFTLLFNFFINYYFVNPVIRITNGVKKFVERRVPFNVEVEAEDEIFDLVNSIDQLCTVINAQAHRDEAEHRS